METSEMPRDPGPRGPEKPEAVPDEAAEARAERPAAEAEALDQEVEDAGKEFEAASAELAGLGAAELSRVTADAAPDELDDPELAEARQEIDAIAGQAKATTEKHKGKLAGIGSRLKRWGRAALAGAVISGTALPSAEAFAGQEKAGQKVEHVEKGGEAPPWNEVIGATEKAVMADADLAAERGEDGRREFMEGLKGFDQERARSDAAEIAGIPLSKVSRDGFRKVEVWSEKKFQAEKAKSFPPLPNTMDAQAENDEIRLRASRFLTPDGHVDQDKMKKGATHEFLHVVSTVDRPDGHQERAWDQQGVPHDLNEGVTELFALRIAEKEGSKIEHHQAYAGGPLVAARLLEGVVGKEALFADFLQGKTDGIKRALDAKLGAGAADRVLSRHLAVGQEGEGLAVVMELARAGVDVEKAWGEAKAEGFLDDLKVSPDKHALTVSRDIEGKMRLSNTLVDDGERLSPDVAALRVFVFTHNEGKPYDAAGVAQAARGVDRGVDIAARTRAGMAKEFAGLAAQYEAAKAAGDQERLRQLDAPAELDKILEQNLPGNIEQAKREAINKGENVEDPNVMFNIGGTLAELQAAYGAAKTPEAKAAARSAIETATEKAARAAAKAIRLESLTPPIPPQAK
ncbi:MAG TPA: hypothetical protein VL426_00680 [Candidatus Binatia bacterium]|nr:hypothetical protein [Candidatus Binatia bacterium]